MEKTKIIFRVDGSAEIGLGHIYRCYSLAQMLSKKFDCVFYTCTEVESVLNMIREKFEVRSLSKENHFEQFINALEGDEVVVLDNYFFDSDYQKSIKSTGVKLVCIDDIYDRHFYADLVINPAPGIEGEMYSKEPYTKLALGLDYVLLRPEFLKASQIKRRTFNNNSLFICFGGSDLDNLTKTSIEVALELNYFEEINVVVGASYPFYEDLANERSDKVKLFQDADETLLVKLMSQSNIAIVPSSGIIFEAMSIGCTIITGVYVDNQKAIYSSLKKQKLIFPAGNFDPDSIYRALQLSVEREIVQEKIIDGKSGKRICDLFQQLELNLRPAATSDCEIVYNWAMDPMVRINSLDTSDILYSDHEKWFSNKLLNPKTKIFILEKNSTPIGQIRFDKVAHHWEIDYSVGKNFRGLGLGKILVRMGIEKMDDSVKAIVKKTNIPSCIIFENEGYDDKFEKGDLVEYYFNKNKRSSE